MNEELRQSHFRDKHATEPIEELGIFSVYYGKGSAASYRFAWCPECQEVYCVEMMHGHGIRKTPQKWAAMKEEGRQEEREAKERAVAWRNAKRLGTVTP